MEDVTIHAQSIIFRVLTLWTLPVSDTNSTPEIFSGRLGNVFVRKYLPSRSGDVKYDVYAAVAAPGRTEVTGNLGGESFSWKECKVAKWRV